MGIITISIEVTRGTLPVPVPVPVSVPVRKKETVSKEPALNRQMHREISNTDNKSPGVALSSEHKPDVPLSRYQHESRQKIRVLSKNRHQRKGKQRAQTCMGVEKPRGHEARLRHAQERRF